MKYRLVISIFLSTLLAVTHSYAATPSAKPSASSKSFVNEDVLDSLKEKLDIIARNSMNYIDVASKPNPAVKKTVFKPSV